MDKIEEYRVHQKEIATKMGFVRLLPLNKDTLPIELFDQMWERIEKADYAFEDFFKGSKEAFVAGMLAGGTYNFEIPGEIFCQLTFAGQGTNAMLHFITLSTGPTAPLVEASSELFWFAFEQIGVQRITAYIPSFNQKVIRLATLMRMKFEGVMRKAFLYNKEYWDIHIYGLLATEYKRRDYGSNRSN
jgi:hypothetical protein